MKRFFGFCVSIIAFAFLAYFLVKSSSSFSLENFQIQPFLLFLSGISAIGFFLFRGVGWHSIMRSHGSEIAFYKSFYYLSKSEIVRYIPGNVWGMGARVINAKRFGSSTPLGIITLFEEIVVLVSSCAVLVSLFIIPLLSQTWSYVILALCITVAITPWIIYRSVFSLIKIFQRLLPFQIDRSLLLSRLQLIKAGSWYVFAWISFAAAHAFAIKALLPNAPIVLTLCFALFAWLCGYVSLLTPSGLGIRELVMTLGLSTKLSQSFSTLFSLASRVWITIIELLVFAISALVYYRKKNDHELSTQR